MTETATRPRDALTATGGATVTAPACGNEHTPDLLQQAGGHLDHDDTVYLAKLLAEWRDQVKSMSDQLFDLFDMLGIMASCIGMDGKCPPQCQNPQHRQNRDDVAELQAKFGEWGITPDALSARLDAIDDAVPRLITGGAE